LPLVKLYALQLSDRLNEPRLTHWDAWGTRVDRIELTRCGAARKRCRLSWGSRRSPTSSGTDGIRARIQFALVYLFHPSTDVYTCPLAMTDALHEP